MWNVWIYLKAVYYNDKNWTFSMKFGNTMRDCNKFITRNYNESYVYVDMIPWQHNKSCSRFKN